ncbi:hypothetical protein M422DRAFT_236142 [Sphaerobolus stellatus SS14]|uniref:Unplaced genomic scaffold SPHSTscaffold_263, whole genome shotgun sequence n=1 Tax=Sphaerobolus stellatus (strain SS14) TaxID=990650 RepID=A0A0C9U000_SPHS4|nr:hypothetical protein M422DRAFT_236142 [Sphaerobolus stellatus SS14]
MRWPDLDNPLTKDEEFWRDHQQFLQQRGYLLRARFRPGWKASWLGTGLSPWDFDDYLFNPLSRLIDAVRIADNSKVVLKRVETSRQEIPIARYLSSDSLRSDARNRTVPVLDVIPLPDTDENALLVMPLLRHFENPPFSYLCEVLEALGQLLQGLEFMHEHNIAHCDACWFNIVMDSSNLIPEGFHYVSTQKHDDLTPISFHGRSRKAVAPVQYYFIDFGLSIHFQSFEYRIYVEGRSGQNKGVPEFLKDIPYDPFKLDIYQFGAVIRSLTSWYFDLEFLHPLVEAMTHEDFEQRPTASEALKQFETIISSLDPESINERVVLFDESFKARFASAMRRMRGRLPRYLMLRKKT